MKTRKAYIKSFGCQMNKLDTALVKESLARKGFEFVDSAKDADLILFNTCSVRERAEQKVLSNLGHIKHLKTGNTDLLVAVIGCMAQRMGGELLENEAVDIVAGPAQIPQLADIVESTLARKQKVLAITENIRQVPGENAALENFESVYDRADKSIPGQAFVRAMRGCNNFCTYCIVPYVRGPEVSRPPQAIVEQVKRLADEGVKLVTLLGQTVNSYEYKTGEKTYNLADMFYALNDLAGIEWIRFVTSYPAEKYFTEICKAIADLPKIAPYLHIPAQSGSDRILKAMNRRYTTAQYLALLEKAREIVPEIALAGDFIVGFPGERDEDFEQTVDLVRRARYKNCFVFKYSPRPGTTADKRLEDSIPDEVKQARNNHLLAVQQEISGHLAEGFLHKEVEVLVEGLSKKPHLNHSENNGNPQLIARTKDDWITVFNAPVELAGQIVKVKITKTAPLTLFTELL